MMWTPCSAAIRQLRTGNRTVSTGAVCAIFWCAIIFIMSSIVLLVTGKHKGTLYQSWGSVMLGCGCCLMLVCIIFCIHAYYVMNGVTRNRQLGLTEQKMELAPVSAARQLVNKHDEARRLLTDSPSFHPGNGYRQTAVPATSSSDRRARLTRMTAVDVDDTESQTSSSCPTSSSSTSPTPPRLYTSPAVHRVECTTMPPLIVAAVSGTQSQFQIPARPVAAAVCRVRPLNSVDWRSGGQHQTSTSTSDQSGGGGSFEDNLAKTLTVSRTSGHHGVVMMPGNTTSAHLYNDHRAISVDDILMCDHDATEAKISEYDSVQQVHV